MLKIMRHFRNTKKTQKERNQVNQPGQQRVISRKYEYIASFGIDVIVVFYRFFGVCFDYGVPQTHLPVSHLT